MTASELRALASAMNWHTSQTFTPSHKETFTQAADVLELIAWAEENRVDVQRGQFFWWSRNVEDGQGGDKTLIELLRRAKEASKS